ncbi:MAG: DUF2158 domain-containing protein [Gammaproteobacteria bacterium]|nr:DUF2158 domain-containing protein [Gammaproteobacteria bacterium]
MSDQAEFKIGDVVCLKSGGPKMTVAHIDSAVILCVWFNGTEFRHAECMPEILTVCDTSLGI